MVHADILVRVVAMIDMPLMTVRLDPWPAGMFPFEMVSPMCASGGTQSFDVSLQCVAAVQRAAFSQRRRHRINAMWTAIQCRTAPLFNDRQPMIDQGWMLQCEIMLLVRIVLQIEQHDIRETVVAVVIAADENPIAPTR